mmetsp:Transcript_76875/g.213561  ORF Transcript_76875/g.213561 Transcript_76875/m.213561 type:complete len:216 (+) Transcript_76875:345-992(+)
MWATRTGLCSSPGNPLTATTSSAATQLSGPAASADMAAVVVDDHAVGHDRAAGLAAAAAAAATPGLTRQHPLGRSFRHGLPPSGPTCGSEAGRLHPSAPGQSPTAGKRTHAGGTRRSSPGRNRIAPRWAMQARNQIRHSQQLLLVSTSARHCAPGRSQAAQRRPMQSQTRTHHAQYLPLALMPASGSCLCFSSFPFCSCQARAAEQCYRQCRSRF